MNIHITWVTYVRTGPKKKKLRPGGCRSPQSRKQPISHVFFSKPISRDTALVTEVQRLLGFMNIRTDLELCLANQRAKPKMVHITHDLVVNSCLVIADGVKLSDMGIAIATGASIK